MKSLVVFIAAVCACVPPGTVTFYDLPNFRGAHITYRVGQSVRFYNHWWNDRISSFKIGEGAKVLFCRAGPCGDLGHGRSTEIIGPHESHVMPNFDNIMSYLSIVEYKQPSVVLFNSAGCQVGLSGVFPVGNHNKNSMIHKNVGGAIRGIWISKATEVTLYDNLLFEGKGVTLKGPLKACNIKKVYKKGSI